MQIMCQLSLCEQDEDQLLVGYLSHGQMSGPHAGWAMSYPVHEVEKGGRDLGGGLQRLDDCHDSNTDTYHSSRQPEALAIGA